MRIDCPHCGARGVEEFSYRGEADLVRPGPDDGPEVWNAYVHLRRNPAGPHRELWHHVAGCRRWLTVTRNTRTHEIFAVEDATVAQAPA